MEVRQASWETKGYKVKISDSPTSGKASKSTMKNKETLKFWVFRDFCDHSQKEKGGGVV